MSFPPPDAPSYPPVRYREPAGERSARLRRSDAPPDLVSPASELFAPGAPRETCFEANVARAAAGTDLDEDEVVAFLRTHDQYEA